MAKTNVSKLDRLLIILDEIRIAKKFISHAWYHPGWKPSNVEIWISD